MDFNLTRAENDEALLSQIETIKTADNITVLIPFAKAYLGMFYVIDKALAEEEKVKLLANEELANAILTGFVASLKRKDLPSIEKIGHAKAKTEEFAEGYVVLAGLDIIAKKSLNAVKELKLELIEKAVGFHYSNKSGYSDIWFEYILSEEKDITIKAISKYWLAMLKNNTAFLPGKNLIFSEKPNVNVVQYCVLPLLDNWKNCKAKTLVALLSLAFQYSTANDFLAVCEHVLEKDHELNEKTRLYWLASAFLISPELYFNKLSAYVGRVKLKIMPLLDFVTLIMSHADKSNITLNVNSIMQLLRMIVPVFPPQLHVYAAIGALDINTKNVMLLFYFLASAKEEQTISEIKKLGKARVMKIYSAVLKNVVELQEQRKNSESFTFPSFNEYMSLLISNDCLQSKNNKFDLR